MPAFSDPEIYRGILESLPAGLCVIDLEKKIVLWSDGAERITGHLRHDVIGHKCVGEALLHCGRQDCEWCNETGVLVRALKTSQPAEAFGFLHHKAGHEIGVWTCAVPVRNEHGSIVGAVEIFEEQQQAADLDHRDQSANPPGCVDELTSVASYAMMRSHLREALGTFAEVQAPFGVLLFRLEGLEEFRARTGADAAASLLRLVARTLEGALWQTDFVGRWSDDQFLVILNGCRKDVLESVRERVGRMLAGDGIEWWGERRSLPVSIGQATPQSGDAIESLMQRAQKSLEAASAAQSRAATAAGGGQSSASQAGS
jgi:diguanylate cyclase (GGDEF)-like protein/PAS domain S-box-containing protein